MNRLLQIIVVTIALAGVCLAQSLGEVARNARAKKPPAPNGKRVYTDDDFVAGPVRQTEADSAAAPKSEGDAATDKDPAKKEGDKEADSEEQMKALEKEWRGKFADQKKEIAQQARELDVLQRENRLRAATFYADAGNRLRNQMQYAEADRKYNAEIAAKQKSVDAAKQTLDSMKDQLRKAGLPSRWAD